MRRLLFHTIELILHMLAYAHVLYPIVSLQHIIPTLKISNIFCQIIPIGCTPESFFTFLFLTLSFVKYFLFLELNITFRVYIHNQAFLKLNEYTFQVINFFIRRYKISIMPKSYNMLLISFFLVVIL